VLILETDLVFLQFSDYTRQSPATLAVLHGRIERERKGLALPCLGTRSDAAAYHPAEPDFQLSSRRNRPHIVGTYPV